MGLRRGHGQKLVLLATVATVALALTLVGGQSTYAARHAQGNKCRLICGEPALGPIESIYCFCGFGSGDSKLLRANVTPIVKRDIGKIAGEREVWEREFTWRSAPGVSIVAAFIVHNGAHKITYQRVLSGQKSGHCKITEIEPNYHPPLLLLEGRRTSKR